MSSRAGLRAVAAARSNAPTSHRVHARPSVLPTALGSSPSAPLLARPVSSRPPLRAAAAASSQRHMHASASSSRQILPESTAAEGIDIQPMSTSEYDEVADEDLDRLHESLEGVCEEYGQGEWEVEYSSGVMNLTLPPGQWVINKQPPNQQIWISSPVSGPARFGRSPEGTWVHFRLRGVTLGAVLDKEVGDVLRSAGKVGDDWPGLGLR